jgi:hypothetical protein
MLTNAEIKIVFTLQLKRISLHFAIASGLIRPPNSALTNHIQIVCHHSNPLAFTLNAVFDPIRDKKAKAN